MGSLANLVGVTTATTGTGAVALGAALAGHRTFVAAAIANGTVVSYSIRDVATGAREVGQGTVSGTGTSMTRVLEDSTTGALLNLSGNAEVYISSLASDAFSDARVRSALLNGVETPITDAPIDSTDAVLTGFRKLIARIANIFTQNNTWTKAQRGAIVTLTDAATITPDFANGNFYTVTLAGNRTLANPTNPVAGQSGSIFIVQDATGSRTLAYGSAWDFAGGTVPTPSTAANAVDRLDYVVRSGSSIHAALAKDVK